MSRRTRFLSAVRLLARGNRLALSAAMCFPEELLPQYPEAIALEFVALLRELERGTPRLRAGRRADTLSSRMRSRRR